MWIKAFKWVGLVALCLGMLYAVHNTGYESGYSAAKVEYQGKNIQLQTKELQTKGFALIEQKRRTEDVTNITTQYHQKMSAVRSEAETTINTLLSGGLRDDLTRKSCLRDTDSPEGDTGTREHGLSEEDVRNLIRLAEEAEEVRGKLMACQKILLSQD